jgi:drug/metabolite transporter (DMT)-like permease
MAIEDASAERSGIGFLLGAAAGFAGMTAAAKLAGARIPLFEIVFVRAALSVLATVALLRHARVPALGTRRPLLFLRGLFGFAGLTCSFYAVIHLPLAEATLLQFTHPLFTLGLAAAVLGERLERGVLLGAPIAVIGLLVVVRPAALFGGTSSELDSFAVGVALLGAFFAADAYVTVRHLARTGEHPLAIVLSFPLVTTFLAAPLAFRDFVWPVGAEWIWLFATGVGAQIGQVCLTRGIQILPASRATTLSYTQVVFASALGALVFGERSDAGTVAGGALVLLGAWLASRGR